MLANGGVCSLSFNLNIGVGPIPFTFRGDGVEKSEDAGREWLQKSADNGNAQAKKALERLSETAVK